MPFPKFRSLILAVALLPFPTLSQAQDSETAFLRLNLAGDMRNETQHIARLACYIGAGFFVEQHTAALEASIEKYQAAQRMLKEGDEAFGLPAENDPRIISALDDLSGEWPDLATLLAADELPPAQIAVIDLLSLSLLKKTETLAYRIANVNSEALQDLPLIMTLSIDMAGRQIMRTEKAAKEACLIGSGIETVKNRQYLEETVTVFSATMDALISGYPGMIVRPPSLEIKTLLENANELWAAPKDALSRLSANGEVSPEDRMVIGGGLEAVVAQLTEVAILYQSIELDE